MYYSFSSETLLNSDKLLSNGDGSTKITQTNKSLPILTNDNDEENIDSRNQTNNFRKQSKNICHQEL